MEMVHSPCPTQAKKSLHSQRREYHRVDPDRKQQRVLTDGIAGKARQRSSEGRMFDHVNRDPDHITSENVKNIGSGEATGDNREMVVFVRDHLLVEGVSQEDCWQTPIQKTHQGPR